MESLLFPKFSLLMCSLPFLLTHYVLFNKTVLLNLFNAFFLMIPQIFIVNSSEAIVLNTSKVIVLNISWVFFLHYSEAFN